MERLEQTGTNGQGNTKPDLKKLRKVCLTLNNYTDEEYTLLKNYCETGTKIQYILGKEKGESGTPHIQGYLEFPNPVSFKKLKEICPRAHWEKAKGNTKQNFTYCSKENDYISNMNLETAFEKAIKECKEMYNNVVWKPWQQNVLDIIKTKPDSRSIHWLWEPTGNTGKSFLCKYIDLYFDAIICEGKSTDVFNQIKTYMDNNKIPRIIIMDIPRSSLGFVNYSAIEKIKNGHIYSGKYEGGKCIFPPPHVICFANETPREHELSADRWKIIQIN